MSKIAPLIFRVPAVSTLNLSSGIIAQELVAAVLIAVFAVWLPAHLA